MCKYYASLSLSWDWDWDETTKIMAFPKALLTFPAAATHRSGRSHTLDLYHRVFFTHRVILEPHFFLVRN